MSEKITVELNDEQVKALDELGMLYGSTREERMKHIIIDVLAAEARRKSEAPVTNITNINYPKMETYPTTWPTVPPQYPYYRDTFIC